MIQYFRPSYYKNQIGGFIMPLTNMLLFIFLISIILLILGFVTKNKILKIISIIFFAIEAVVFIMFIIWIGKMWFIRLIHNIRKICHNRKFKQIKIHGWLIKGGDLN